MKRDDAIVIVGIDWREKAFIIEGNRVVHLDRNDKRFWSKVDKTGDCWEWTATKSDGYGRFAICDTQVNAQRISYWLAVGPIPDGMVIDHLCRNRGCVRPEHLEAVTVSENTLRGEGQGAKNRRKTHCNNNHPLSGENLRVGTKGQRVCRTCQRAAEARRPQRKHG